MQRHCQFFSTRPSSLLLTLPTKQNGGDPYTASADAGVAVLNTNICTAMSSLVWVACDLIYFRKPSVIGAIQGMITGLVAITPAAGVVAGWGAIILGLFSGTIPWLTMNIA